jgi:hypothetical protein
LSLLFRHVSGWIEEPAQYRILPKPAKSSIKGDMPMNSQDLKGVRAILGHPLFLLVIGSIIGSLLIPWIGDKISRNKVVQDARLRKAIEIVDNNTKTVSQLNSMVTRLTSFHENNVRRSPAPDKLRELQEKLVEDMDSRWAEFEKTGWWWYQDLNDEAVILGMIPAGGSATLRQHVNAYHDNSRPQTP